MFLQNFIKITEKTKKKQKSIQNKSKIRKNKEV